MSGEGRASEHFAVLLLLTLALSPAIAGEGRTPRGERENRWRHRAVNTGSMRAPPSIVNGRALPIDGKGTTGKERLCGDATRTWRHGRAASTASPAGLSRGSLFFCAKKIDGRVKPGNDAVCDVIAGSTVPRQNKSVAGTSPATPQT